MATPINTPLILDFKEDSPTTLSRSSLRALAKHLGLDETQTVFFALARLRDEMSAAQPSTGSSKDFAPLNRQQHKAIAKAAPKRRGKVVDSLTWRCHTPA